MDTEMDSSTLSDYVPVVDDWTPTGINQPRFEYPGIDCAHEKRKELCFRVETTDGRSMYNVGCPFYDRDIHPAPEEDAGLKDFWRIHIEGYGGPYYFGFASMEQLRRWVYRDQQELADRGLGVSIYQTDDYCIGDTQMVFRKKTAVLIGRAALI